MTTLTWPEAKYSATDAWWKSWKLRQVPHWGTITIIFTEHQQDKRLIIPEHPTTANAIAALLYAGYRTKHHAGLNTRTESPTGVVSTMYIPDRYEYEIASYDNNGRAGDWAEDIKGSLTRQLINIDETIRRHIMLQPLANLYPVVAAQNPPYYPPRDMRIDLCNDPVWVGALDAIADKFATNPDINFVD